MDVAECVRVHCLGVPERVQCEQPKRHFQVATWARNRSFMSVPRGFYFCVFRWAQAQECPRRWVSWSHCRWLSWPLEGRECLLRQGQEKCPVATTSVGPVVRSLVEHLCGWHRTAGQAERQHGRVVRLGVFFSLLCPLSRALRGRFKR